MTQRDQSNIYPERIELKVTIHPDEGVKVSADEFAPEAEVVPVCSVRVETPEGVVISNAAYVPVTRADGYVAETVRRYLDALAAVRRGPQ